MSVVQRDRTLIVWIGLIAATVAAWVLGTDHGIDDAQVASSLVLLIAFAKIRFVGRYFMELRDAPAILVGLFEGWVLVVCGAVVAMYLAA